MKRCLTCFRELDESEFRPRVKKQDGREYTYRSSTCRSCEADYARAIPRAKKRASQKKWEMKDPEHVRALGRRYFREQHEKYLAKLRNRRAKTHAGVTEHQWEEIVALHKGRCAYCVGPYEEMDHVVPLSRGGRHEPGNVVPACRDCNRSKGSRTPEEWRSDGVVEAAA